MPIPRLHNPQRINTIMPKLGHCAHPVIFTLAHRYFVPVIDGCDCVSSAYLCLSVYLSVCRRTQLENHTTELYQFVVHSSMQIAGLGTCGTGTCGTGTALLGHALLGHAELNQCYWDTRYWDMWNWDIFCDTKVEIFCASIQ